MTRFVLLGAHLEPADAGVDGAVILDGPLSLSAIAVDGDHDINSNETLMRAAAARSELIAREIFVAIRYGASVGGRDEAFVRCASHLDRWRELLTAHRGEVEATLKIAGDIRAERPDRRDFRCGTDYLKALQNARSSQLPDPSVRRAIETRFASVASRHRWLARNDGGSELAMLIPRSAVEKTRTVAETLASVVDRPYLFSAPWPLEVFSDE